MDVDNFFEDLNEKNWKQNTHTEASYLFDEFIDILKESKEDIVRATLKDIELFQEMKLEEGQELTYRLFKEWLARCMVENITSQISEEE